MVLPLTVFRTQRTALQRLAFLYLLLFSLPATAQPMQEMLLLKTWQPSQDINGWLMSEKLDGVRARWDGHQLISRGGHLFSAPAWFTRGFPPFPLDGELWSKRGDFEHILSVVRRQQAHAGWKQLSYQIFELPGQAGGLPERLQVLAQYLSQHPAPYLRIIRQIPCTGKNHMRQHLQQLISLGAEGLVLRNPSAPSQTGRSPDALKVKNFTDTECTVVDYKPGKGALKGVTGALLCRMQNGAVISIGSGLGQALRITPPPLGQMITFKYYGLTKKGNPRHPVFLRLWHENIM